MPTVEGLTPQIMWSTLYGVFAVALLFLIGFKVYDAIHTLMERRRQRKEAIKPDFADKVSKQVIKDLGPRLERIESDNASNKSRLDSHDMLIANIQTGQREIHDGLSAIAKFMIVLSTFGNIGDNEKVKEATAELQKFLAEKL